jgi:hypothetical protein
MPAGCSRPEHQEDRNGAHQNTKTSRGMSQPILLRLPPRPPGGKTNPQKQNPPKISTGLSAV